MHNTLPILQATDFPALHRGRLTTLQVNLGYRCNQACLHCHVNAGPNRSVAMDDATIELIPRVLSARGLSTLDLTGGAPELHPRLQQTLNLLVPGSIPGRLTNGTSACTLPRRFTRDRKRQPP